MKKIIVIVSYKADKHAHYVRQKLEKLGETVFLLNFGEYPDSFQSSVQYSSDKPEVINFRIGKKLIYGDQIKSVWWRRPLGCFREEKIDLMEEYIRSEAETYARSLPLLLTRAFWVSNADATRVANRKPYQLVIARNAGFKIPESLIGNSAKDVSCFLDKMNGRAVIMKAVNSAFVRLNARVEDPKGLNRAIYTKIVSPKLLKKNCDMIRDCPFILQEAIPKDIDIRVTVVGEKTFAAGIEVEVPAKLKGTLDWRCLEVKKHYVKHNLPSEITRQCVAVTRNLGLVFGCIDLAFSRKNGYTFFEINPQGQWLPSEEILGYPISIALSELLIA